MFVKITQDGQNGYWYDKSRGGIGLVFEVTKKVSRPNVYWLVMSPFNDARFNQIRPGHNFVNGKANGKNFNGLYIDADDCIEVESLENNNKALVNLLDKEW